MRHPSKEASGHDETDGDRGLGAFVRRHGLISYYALAYGLSWLVWLPFVLSQNGLGLLHVPYPEILGTQVLAGILPGAYLGPLGAAFVVTALSEGREGLRRWTGRLFRWGVSWRWYAFALAAVPAIIVAGSLVLPGVAAGFQLPPVQLLLLYVPFLLFQMVTTGLAEEPGWRDFALVRHQRLHGPFVGTLILSLLWAGWHFPLILTEWGQGIGGATPSAVLLFVGLCISLSFVVTWVFNRTNESLPLAIVVHVSNNTFASILWSAMFTVGAAQTAVAGAMIGYSALALVLVVATRGQLGYDGPHDDRSGKRAGEELAGVPARGPGAADRGGDLPAARKT